MSLADGRPPCLACMFWDFSHSARQEIVQWSRKHNSLSLKPPAPSWSFFFSVNILFGERHMKRGGGGEWKANACHFRRPERWTTVIFLCMQDFTEPSVFLNMLLPVKGRAISSLLRSVMQWVGEHHLDTAARKCSYWNRSKGKVLGVWVLISGLFILKSHCLR